MVESVEQFVTDLSLERTRSLFNQYSSDIDGLDRPGGAAIRRANLRAYLESRIGAPLALIGEAPSAHGARFSGIAFTAERSLVPEQRTSAHGLKPLGFTEHSATILGRALEAANLDPTAVAMWNVVPFHPARANDPLRNWTPRPEEIALGADWLRRFLELIRPGRIAAVGQTAGRALPIGTTILRHPSFGGSRELRSGIAALASELRVDARHAP